MQLKALILQVVPFDLYLQKYHMRKPRHRLQRPSVKNCKKRRFAMRGLFGAEENTFCMYWAAEPCPCTKPTVYYRIASRDARSVAANCLNHALSDFHSRRLHIQHWSGCKTDTFWRRSKVCRGSRMCYFVFKMLKGTTWRIRALYEHSG